MLISDFARLGQVSVRMLRHYDRVGLLRPERVDPVSGYRSYSPEQLHVLNCLVALKDLGFTLDQVRVLLDERVGPEEMRGMLRLRRAQLEEEARLVGTRLTAVEWRLRMIEEEHVMSADYVVKTIPATRLVALRATVDPDRLAEHIGPMFAEVQSGLASIRGALEAPIATYAETDAGMDIAVGYAYDGPAPAGTEVLELPEVTAVCGVHLGEMARIGASWQALERWVLDNGYELDGPCRELYVRAESPDQADWVTELQQPVRR